MSKTYDACCWIWNLLTFKDIDINRHLVTELMERWRTKTHTFHLQLGETIVTLEDLAL